MPSMVRGAHMSLIPTEGKRKTTLEFRGEAPPSSSLNHKNTQNALTLPRPTILLEYRRGTDKSARFHLSIAS